MSTARTLTETAERLCALSRERAIDPVAEIVWPDAVDANAWYTSPEFVSLFGTSTWDALDDASRKRVAFLEAVNFYSLNIHGERALIEGLARRLYRGDHATMSPYLHHFLEEESRHMAYFGRFCTLYAGGPYAEKKLVFPREFAPGEEDALFFAKVLIFEELVDVLNRRMAKDERLHPLAHTINRLHHDDKVRHLEFGRRITADTFERFAATVRRTPEILECHMVAGGFDYLIKARVSDMAAYRAFLGETLVNLPGVRETRTYAVLEEVKNTVVMGV